MKIEEARVLIVGAGGIGCELLKNVVLSGYKTIHLVDLDTIELSNLNRQFLFRRKHIGLSKAEVARESALKMDPSASITASFANIMDTGKFPISFFKNFDLVMNALDNLGARKYVNLMCLMAKVPLIESGTAGYLGQTSIIINRKTECFECVAKEPPKTFPVCTIRSTPSSPIHCIVWSKEFLLPNLFGQENSSNSEFNNEENSNTLKDTWTNEQVNFSALKELRNNPKIFYETLIKKLFIEDILKIIKIEELWKDRPVPIPVSEDLISFDKEDCFHDNDHEIWSLEACFTVLKSSIIKLIERSKIEKEILFDKDDQDTLDLIASASNIRAKVFGIPLTSKFEIKAMAGNIIPAIATTNSIAAAMITIHAKNILSGLEDNLCNTYINYGGSNARNAFTIEKLCKPNPECHVCSSDRGLLILDCDIFTIKEVLHQILPKYLECLRSEFGDDICEFDEEDILVLEGNRLLYDIDDDCGNGNKTLKSIGVTDSKFLKIDFSPRRSLLLGIIHQSNCTNDLTPTFQIEFDLIEPKNLKHLDSLKRKLEESSFNNNNNNNSSSEDECVCILEEDGGVEKVDFKKTKTSIS